MFDPQVEEYRFKVRDTYNVIARSGPADMLRKWASATFADVGAGVALQAFFLEMVEAWEREPQLTAAILELQAVADQLRAELDREKIKAELKERGNANG